MSERTKSKLLTYGITGGACLLLAVSYLIGANFLELEGPDRLRILCDAFTIPGLLCLFSGVLIWLAQEGSFDGIGYVVSYAFHALLPGSLNKRESYKDYLERKKEKKPISFGFLLITGAVFTGIALVFLMLFHMQ